MATNGILVPVSLYIENLLKIINDLKGQLGNLKVGSSGFKAMENHIRALQKELDKFLILASKPFLTENLFIAAEKSVDKLEDEIERVSLTASRLKFSDLELNGELKALLKAVEDLINAIKASFKTLKDTAKLNFLDTDLGLLWTKLHPEDTSRSLDLITNSIRRAVKELGEIVKEAESVVEGYQRAITMGDAVKSMNKTHGKGQDPDALKALMGNEFSTFFKELKNGKIQFLDGQQGFFTAWLVKNFELDESVIKDLLKASGPRIAALLNDANSSIRLALNGAVAKADSAKTLLPSATLNAAELDAQLKQLTATLNAATGATDGMKVSEEQLREALTAAGITLENTKEGIAADVRAKQEWRNVNQLGTAELNNLRTALLQTNAQFLQQLRITLNFNSMKMAVVNFMGFRLVLNLTRTAIREAINHIKELDSVMNKISIVTNMSTSDLWAQVDAYSKMAQLYGTTIKGAYEVSLIYYQLGLETQDVLTLTNETLKLAKVSGLDYAQTTDYMTTALRGFKMEMSEASTVVDVYSNLAAHTAVTQEELAVAMSKTASSMESVGSTFEETSAMIGTMVAVTRESATNIGSALKSIASRYGEMKQDPLKLVDSEGDEISYNKVDAALQSVGISMKTVDGQFRSFTEVIIELSEKWDQLESTQQRYIATLFAGNRQQSRFLALVSNPELLKANLGYAEESEDTGTLQALKALDSIESKLNLVLVAYQQFYTTMGVENVWKGFLDGAKNVINTLNRMPKLFNVLPIGAINAIVNVISVVKSLALSGLSNIALLIGKNFISGINSYVPAAEKAGNTLFSSLNNALKNKMGEAENTGKLLGNAYVTGFLGSATLNSKITSFGSTIKQQKLAEEWITRVSKSELMANPVAARYEVAQEMQAAGLITANGFLAILNGGQEANSMLEFFRQLMLLTATTTAKVGSTLSGVGSALNLLSLAIDTTSTHGKTLSGVLLGVAGVAITAGALIKAASDHFNTIPWMAIASGAIAVINGISLIILANSLEAKLEEATSKAEELSNKAKELKANYRTLDTGIKKYKELEKARYDSAEAAEEYLNAVDEIVEKFPLLIGSFDETGNAILSAVTVENELAEARRAAAEAAYAAAKAEVYKSELELTSKKEEIKKSAEAVGLSDQKTSKSIRGAHHFTSVVATYTDEETGKTVNISGNNNSSNLMTTLFNNYDKLDKYGAKLLDWILKLDKSELTDSKILTLLLDNTRDEALSGNYTAAEESALMVRLAYNYLNWKPTDKIEKNLSQLENLLTEVTPIYNQIIASGKEAVNAWIRYSDYSLLPFISESSGLLGIVQNQLYELALGDYSKGNLSYYGNKLLSPINTLWTTLSDNIQLLVNEIVNHPENYTAADLQKVLSNAHIDLMLIPTWIYKTFNDLNDSIHKALTQKADLIITELQKEVEVYSDFYTMLESETTQFTLNELKFLVEALDLIASITESGFSADSMMGATNKLFSLIQSLSYDARNALLLLILTNGFSTEGWSKTLDYIINNTQFNFDSINTDVIDTIIKESIPNYKLTASSAINAIEESWEDLDKFFSSLSKGVNKTEISSLVNLAKALGLSLDEKTDFISDGENMIISSTKLTSLIEDYKIKLSTSINNLKTDLDKTYTRIKESTSYIDKYGLLESGRMGRVKENVLLEDYKRVLGADFDEYFELRTVDGKLYWYAKLKEGETLLLAEQRIREAVDAHVTNNNAELLSVIDYYNILFSNLSKSLKWKSGDYSSLNDILKNGDKFEDILKDPKKLQAEEYINLPDIQSAFNLATLAYSNLISDVLSKGLKNINIKDYEGLDNDIEIITDNISYRDFVNNYAQYANKTAAEINDLLILAILKDQAKVSSDVLKDLTFIDQDTFTTSLEGLKELANIYEVKAEDFNNWINEYYNAATDEATVRVSDLLKKYLIDLTKVNDFTLMVLESVDSLFNSLTSNIKNALSGSMDSKGTKNLTDTLRQLGLNAELSFTRTKDGYKLATELVVQLYNELKSVDAITSLIVLDELNKSLDDATIKANGLLKEIDQLRATTESDSYKFMSNKIPGGQNNPINYYENWATALLKFRDALKQTTTVTDYKTGKKEKKQGLIDYQDWYNMVTEMGKLADISEEPVKIGNKLLHNSKEAQDLLEQSASALTVDSSGKMKIALSDIADLGIDFSSGAEDMAKNVDAGIRTYALSLVKMLDGMILLMETVVAMEGLGDIAGEDNKIDLSELLPGITFDDNGNALRTIDSAAKTVEAYNTWRLSILELLDEKNSEKYNKDLADAAEKIKIGGKSFSEILNMDLLTIAALGEDFVNTYNAVLNSFYQSFLSGDYNLDNIVSSIKEILALNGYTGTIDLGETELHFVSGVAIEYNKEEQYYTWNGHKFKDETAAIKAAKISQVSTFSNLTQNYDYDTGVIKYTGGKIEISTEYDITKNQYIARFGDDAVYAKTPEELNAGIRHYIELSGVDLEAADNSTTILGSDRLKYTIELKGIATVDVILDTKTGLVTVNPLAGKGIDTDTLEDIKRTGSVVVKKTIEENQQEGEENPVQLNIEIGENKVQEQILENVKLAAKNPVKLHVELISEKEPNTSQKPTIDTSNIVVQAAQQPKGKPAQLKEISYALTVLETSLLQETANLAIKLVDDSSVAVVKSSNEVANSAVLVSNAVETTLTKTSIAEEALELAIKKGTETFINAADDAANKALLSLNNNIPFEPDMSAVDTTLKEYLVPSKEMIIKPVILGGNTSISGTPGGSTGGNTGGGAGGGVYYYTKDAGFGSTLTTKLGKATGNIALAKGTLLGELGPELVVSNGRYFIAGLNGAEVMDLADDAIVFNHLQTKSLLEKGMSNGRGKAVTNERNAVSYAKGNINGGPAQASASAALSALKKLRAQWQALAGLSAQDLAGKGGGGGGGGGDPKAFIKDLEKWYNWLQRIAVLEQKINYEEQLRSKYQSDMIAHGREYAQSQLDTLPYLKEQAAINKSLYESQLAYFDKRRAEMNDASNPFTSLYTFDEYGQLKYKDGALAKLSELSGRNSLTGQANYTAAEQYEKLVAMGYGKYMEYDSSGNKIDLKADDWQVNAVQAFWDKIDADQQEMLSLHDSVEEHKTAMLQAQLKLNEILKAIEDNLIAVEDKVLGAIVDMRERAIKLMQDERNAIEESANNLIDGLSNQLLKERDMYSKQQDANELTKLQRQLGILQRSGGSASLIASLLKEITSKQLDAYFEAQQAQIDALQEASDNELERLDRLIELEEEQLAYEKENGLLWNLVYEQMAKSPEEIATFIHLNTSSYWADSPIKSAQEYRDTLFQAQEFVLYREKVEGGLDALIAANSDLAIAEQAANVTALGEAAAEASASAAGDLSGSSSGGSSGVTGTGKYRYKRFDKQYHITEEKMSDGTWKNLGKIKHTLKDGKCTRCGQEIVGGGGGGRIGTLTNRHASFVMTYDIGGMVDETGPAYLHARESVLTPELTSILRNDILSNKPTSLLSLLTDFRDAYNSIPNASAYDTINSGSGVSIENAIVEMNVSKIANDYDAQRAGELALDKMLLIARKTQAQNRIGR